MSLKNIENMVPFFIFIWLLVFSFVVSSISGCQDTVSNLNLIENQNKECGYQLDSCECNVSEDTYPGKVNYSSLECLSGMEVITSCKDSCASGKKSTTTICFCE